MEIHILIIIVNLAQIHILQMIAVIVGSEPQIGKNPEIRIPSGEVKQMVYTEPIPVPEND